MDLMISENPCSGASRCRACTHFGDNTPESEPQEETECRCKTNTLRNRIRNHNDEACAQFELVDWLKRIPTCLTMNKSPVEPSLPPSK